MKNIKVKLVGILIAIVFVALTLPTKVLGANDELQVVCNEEGNYVIYAKSLQKGEGFKFAISDNPTAKEIDLNYINSVTDEENNQVALVEKAKYEGEKYIYIKTDSQVICEGQPINFAEAFDQQKMEKVETTTNRIATEVVTDIVEKEEQVNGVNVKITVGGLEITDSKNDTYYYATTKLPAEKYSELKALAENINANYNDMDMYTRIETAKQFYNLYIELVEKQNWVLVENMTIMQPNDAEEGEEYVVYLKKVDENGKEIVNDVKFMTSYRTDTEQSIPGMTEQKIVKETTKLPITGDSMVLFTILAIIIIVAIVVFVKMKKLQDKKAER